MAKVWTLIATSDLSFGNKETRAHRINREKKFDNAIKKANKMTVEQLQKDADAAFDATKEVDQKLLVAFREDRVKSKEAIKKAQMLDKKDKDRKKSKG